MYLSNPENPDGWYKEFCTLRYQWWNTQNENPKKYKGEFSIYL